MDPIGDLAKRLVDGSKLINGHRDRFGYYLHREAFRVNLVGSLILAQLILSSFDSLSLFRLARNVVFGYVCYQIMLVYENALEIVDRKQGEGAQELTLESARVDLMRGIHIVDWITWAVKSASQALKFITSYLPDNNNKPPNPPPQLPNA